MDINEMHTNEMQYDTNMYILIFVSSYVNSIGV